MFRFASSSGCPVRRDFIQRVSQLSGDAEPEQIEQRLAMLLRSVRVGPHGVELWLRSTADGEQAAARHIVAQGCQEATSAAALVAAIALRSAPPTNVEPVVEPVRAPSAQDAHTAQRAQAEPSPLVQAGAVLAPRRLDMGRAEAQAEDAGEAMASQGVAVWALAATAGTDRALGPGFPTVVSVGIGRHWGPWSVRLSALHARASAQPDGRRAEFVAWAGSGEVCRRLAGADAGSGWQMGACTLLRAGALEGRGDEGSELSVSHVESRTIMDPGFALSARSLRFLGLRASLELGAMVPVFRHEFLWESPRRSVYSVPVVAPFAMLGLELPAVGSP